MVTDNIKMKQDNYDVFDKKKIALAIRNSTYEDDSNDDVIKKCCDTIIESNVEEYYILGYSMEEYQSSYRMTVKCYNFF